jgi:hypothetical protein
MNREKNPRSIAHLFMVIVLPITPLDSSKNGICRIGKTFLLVTMNRSKS